MSRQVFGWGVGFGLTAAMALVLVLAALRSPPRAEAIVKRDASKVSSVELELILNKIREGDLLSIRGDADGARRAWGEARRMGEGLWPIHEGLGDSYSSAKLYDDALREYAVAAPMVPENLAAMRFAIEAKRARALGDSGKPLEAIRAYLELNQPARTGPAVLDLALKTDREQAVKLVADQAEIHDPRVFLLLSALLRQVGREVESAEALAKFCVAVAPWDEALDLQAVNALKEAKRHDRAVEVCRAWAKSSPGAIRPYQVMGDVLRDAGREKEAVVAYSSIVDVKPGDAEAHRTLGEIFRGMNRLDDAIAQYLEAKKARPEDQVTYTALASLYQAKGQREKAEDLLFESTARFGMAQPEARGKLVAAVLDRIEKARVTAREDEVSKLREKYVNLGIAEAGLFDLKVVMSWDAATHIDLDVIEPGGVMVNHDRDASPAGGKYYMHNTTGFGPETYTIKSAPPGVYQIGAHRHDKARTTVKFTVILFEGTPRESRRQQSIVMENEKDDVMTVALSIEIPK